MVMARTVVTSEKRRAKGGAGGLLYMYPARAPAQAPLVIGIAQCTHRPPDAFQRHSRVSAVWHMTVGELAHGVDAV